MMGSRPLVSIVTTSYNQAAYLEETMRSVLDQDYEPLEYLVIDDGSTDGSADIVRRYADRLAWWDVQENRGQAEALNQAFAHARGDLLGFVSSDDTLLAGAVSRLAGEFERDPALLLVYGGADYIDERSRRVGAVPTLDWDLGRFASTGIQPIPQPASLWSRRAWDLAGPFSARSWALFDTEFYLRIGAAGRVRRVPETLATFRLHSASKQLSRHGKMADECVRFADEFFGSDALPAALRPYARSGRATFYRRGALSWYAAGDIPRARRLFLRSLVLSPRGMDRRQLTRLVRTLAPARVVRHRRRARA
jgi:glycosyltransferase involved in cell wall biosynthesis